MLVCVGGCGCVVLLWTRSLKKCLYMIVIRVHTTVGTRARTRQSEHERQSPTTSLLGSEVTGERQGKLVLYLLCMMSNVSPTLSGVQTEMGATQATKPNPPATEVARTQGKRDCCFCSHIQCLLIQAHYDRETRLPATGLDSLIGERQGKLVLHLLCMMSNVSPTLSGVQTEMGATQATKPNPPATEVARTQGKRDCCVCSHIQCLLIQAHYNRETRLPATGLDSLIWVGVQRLGVRVSCAGVCGHVVSRSVCICMPFVYIPQLELVQGPDRVNTRDRALQRHFWGQKRLENDRVSWFYTCCV